jgi:hypothetical protein
VLDAEVSDKGGLTGIAVKTTFALVRNLQPDFVPRAIDGLLDDFVGQIDPFYQRWEAAPGGKTMQQYLVANGGAVADALLSITDNRAAKTTHKVLKNAYEKLRPKGKEHVVAAMPRVGALLERHVKAG